jgi:hypothetical protein
VVAALGALPLALEQAGAYMADTGTTITGYHGLLQHQRSTVLAQGEPWGYPSRVASTWQLAFDTLAGTNVEAISLIWLLACYAPDAIPYRLLLTPLEAGRPQDLLVTDELRTHRSRTLDVLRSLPGTTLDVNRAISLLRRQCLIRIPAADHVSIHRLVQAVTLDNLPAAARAAWRRAACALLQGVLPAGAEEEAVRCVAARPDLAHSAYLLSMDSRAGTVLAARKRPRSPCRRRPAWPGRRGSSRASRR